MAIELKVPSVGESVTEGRIARWIRKHGETVKADEPVFELDSDKATQEIAAPAAGVLHTLIPEGEMVKIGQLVATIEANGSVQPAPPKPSPSSQTPMPPSSTAADADPGRPDVILSPAARVMVAERDIDPAAIAATGPGGRVTKTDVLNHAEPKPAAAKSSVVPSPPPVMKAAIATTPTDRETRRPMTMIRRRIAERLLDSQNSTATLTTFNEVDMSAAMDLRTRYNERFEKKYGIKLGFMSIFVKAAIEALKAFPLVNARIDGTDVVEQHFYDIGVAVSTEKGLMVPVLRDADRMGFAGIEKALSDIAKRARDGKVKPEEMMGGTFTVTNGGIFGSMMSTPILNPPQTAILGMHAITKRPVVVNDQIVIRPMMYVAMSYDHRLLDGREAVQFLVRIKECVENPERMLFEV
jgi:2-oxoglutarate dehydrogenase E2 component (dihydrolipoamide succinyltransferase)